MNKLYVLQNKYKISLQCCRDFKTRKLACNIIWYYANYIEHVFFENNITSLQDKPTDVNVFKLSLTI